MNINLTELAQNAKLSFSDEEAVRFERDLSEMLGRMMPLPPPEKIICEEVEVKTIKLRKDKTEDSLTRELLLQNSPESEAGCFSVPKTVEN